MSKTMRAVFGGQVMGQALMSAWKCVSELNSSFLLHSFHCYFVGPMKVAPDVIYRVTRVKDGNNFCSLSVVAVQDTKVCFHCLASFQKPADVKADVNYSRHPMPKVPHPSDPVTLADLSDDDMFAINVKKVVLRSKRKWSAERWPCEMYMCMDVATAKKRLAKEPTNPRSVMLVDLVLGDSHYPTDLA